MTKKPTRRVGTSGTSRKKPKSDLPKGEEDQTAGAGNPANQLNPEQVEAVAKVASSPNAAKAASNRNNDMTTQPKSDQGKPSADRWYSPEFTQAYDNLNACILIADADHIIRYVNNKTVEVFSAAEKTMQEVMPSFRVSEVVGGSIHRYHKNAEHQRQVLKNLGAYKDSEINVNGIVMRFRTIPLRNDVNEVEAYVVELNDATPEVEAKKLVDFQMGEFKLLLSEMQRMSDAHDEGDIDVMCDTTKFETKEIADAVQMVNDMVQAHIDTKKSVMAVFQSFGQGNFEADMPRQPRKKVFINNVIDESRDTVKELAKIIGEISDAIVEGNLAFDFDTSKFNGEWGKIAQSFGRVFSSLSNTFSTMAEQVDQVGTTVDQMSNVSQSLSTNSQIGSASVDEVSASAEETDAQVKANAEAAQKANHFVGSAAELASNGSEKMKAMVVSMDGIKTSSQDIAKIIKVIDEIAFQTNLLALNAAVEAARAGQHGRGFAVVAQEVRNLAGRSAKAARETSDLIEDASNRVNQGVRIADETSEAFTKINSEILQVKQIVEAIDEASSEQSRGVAQISQAIGEIAKTTLATSQQADELAATASQMTSAMNQMNEEIKRFKLRPRRGGMAGMPNFDQMSPEMLAQIQKMMNGSSGGGAKRNGLANSVDKDSRGYGSF